MYVLGLPVVSLLGLRVAALSSLSIERSGERDLRSQFWDVTVRSIMAKTPVQYSDDIARKLLRLIAEGMSLRKACEQPGMPCRDAWATWRHERPELDAQYARARAERANARADEIIEIADDEEIPVESRKVRIDARKWEASKLDRHTYGERSAVDVTGKLSLDSVIAETLAKNAPPKAD